MPTFLALSDPGVRAAVLAAARRILVDPEHRDVVGFTIGQKRVDDRPTGSLALVMLVDEKPHEHGEPGEHGEHAGHLVERGWGTDAAEFLRDDAFSGYQILVDVQEVGR